MTPSKLILYTIICLLGLIVFVMWISGVSAGTFSPRQIEDKIYDAYGTKNMGGMDCKDRAKAAKEMAEECGYRAVYRSSRTHRWVAIYTENGIVEIMK
jgi:hypothetical protein